MDIYKYAEKINYGADYLDMHTGLMYLITRAKEYDGKIPVEDENGEIIGFAKRIDDVEDKLGVTVDPESGLTSMKN